MKRPLIGITVDNVNSSLASGKYKSNVAYSRSVAEAGGIPLLLPQEVALAEYYVDLCDGLMLTGGDDILPEPFGVERHPEARCMEPQRQAFELSLARCDCQKRAASFARNLHGDAAHGHACGRENGSAPT